LQPVVENAVKHGIAPLRQGGEVSVTARLERTGDDLWALALLVTDTGAGSSEAALRRSCEAGVGLKNVKRRLACQFGDQAALTITSAPGIGTMVKIVMPVKDVVATGLTADVVQSAS
jgi:sensor histidine kinase YesM